MKIDWKHLATTEGYKSLKNDVIRDIKSKRTFNSKENLWNRFHWIINRAKHYAHETGLTIENILNQWEAKRNYWWVNYYQESNFQKLTRTSTVKKQGLTGLIKYYKTDRWYINDPKHIRNRILSAKQEHAKKLRTKKPKWSAKRKQQAKKYREYYP